MASERALDVLRRIDIGECLTTRRASAVQIRRLASVRRRLLEAHRDMPVSGFGLYGDANRALEHALGKVMEAEGAAFERYVQAVRNDP